LREFFVDNVDIRSELSEFDWQRATWTDDKLIAASPFRYDRTPSFYVYLRDTPTAPAGSWGDSGAYDDEWAKGGFVKLLAFLRNETEQETLEYLRIKYGTFDVNNLTITPPALKLQRSRQPLSEALLAGYDVDYTYLSRRGIPPKIQRLMGVKFALRANAVVMPWRLPNGKLANVKYRKTRGKAFWYLPAVDAWPIRDLIYGIDVAHKRGIKQMALVEAEIDAMSVMAAGVFALATGGSTFNKRKAELILASPIEELIVITDNDKAGEKLREEIERELYGKIALRHGYVKGAKDVNEVLTTSGKAATRAIVEEAEKVRVTFHIRGFT
jgi:5S rRNA maturation endonuclease (ribonuclease M5)